MTTTASGRKLTSACNGVTTVFPTPKLRGGDLQVFLLDDPGDENGDGTLLNEGSDYVLAADLRSIVTTAPYPLGKYIRRWRQTPRAQNVQIEASKAVPAATQEDALDRLSLVDEEQDDDLGRTLRSPPGDRIGPLPLKSARAGHFLAFDAAGEPVEAPGTGSDGALRGDLADPSAAGKNAGLVGFRASLLYGAGTLGAAVMARGVHASDAPFNCTGAGDETAGLTAFFNHAQAHPGVPHYLDYIVYTVSDAMPAITVPGTIIRGGGASIHDVGALMTGCVISYAGAAAAGKKLLQVTATSGAGNQHIANVEITGIGLNCNALIGVGLEVLSARFSTFHVAIANATVAGFRGSVVDALGEARDCADNDIHLLLRQIEAPNAYGYVLDGQWDNVTETGANFCFNDMVIAGQFKNVALGNHINSDNNAVDVRAIRAFDGTATESIRLCGGAYAGNSCRDEIFELSANVAMKIYGTPTFSVPATGHKVTLDLTNSTPQPVLGTGATCIVTNPVVGAVAVAQLPAAGIGGRRAVVTDASATTFASIVAAGGANKVPVYDDGTNWRIG